MQGLLFGPAVRPAAVPPDLSALAGRLPDRIRFGTSSWSFPGWVGLVWAERCAESALSQQGLGAYAAHPLLRAVGLDRTFYAPMPRAELAALADAVPPGFRFLVKAHEDLTTLRFPDHPRYGPRRGQENPRFLDPAWARTQVVEPAALGLGAKLGCLTFQFAPQSVAALGGPAGFARRMHEFLAALPAGPRYTVEVRNEALLTRALADALAEAGAAPCYGRHGPLPPITAQRARVPLADGAPLVVRWMLPVGMDYEGAKSAFAPFDRLAAPDPRTREDMAEAIADAWREGRDVLVIINNKAEGSAPRSVVALAEAVVRRLG